MERSRENPLRKRVTSRFGWGSLAVLHHDGFLQAAVTNHRESGIMMVKVCGWGFCHCTLVTRNELELVYVRFISPNTKVIHLIHHQLGDKKRFSHPRGRPWSTGIGRAQSFGCCSNSEGWISSGNPKVVSSSGRIDAELMQTMKDLTQLHS